MFKIGDKVVMATATSGSIPVGAKGVVQDLHDDGVFRVVVDFGDTLSYAGNILGKAWCMKEDELKHDQETA